MLQKSSNQSNSRAVSHQRDLHQVAKARVQQIVKAYRLKLGIYHQPLSFAKFANELEKSVRSLGIGVSYQSVKNWEDGVHLPDHFFVIQLSIHAPDGSWQNEFAKDVLAAQWPELYEPVSEIGKHALQQLQQN